MAWKPAIAAASLLLLGAATRETKLILAADGIEIRNAGGGYGGSRFGRDEYAVADDLKAAIGEPEGLGGPQSCDGVKLREDFFAGGFILYIYDTRFAGWRVGKRKDFRTKEGMGLGSTFAEVQALMGPAVELRQRQARIEFTAKGISGTLSKPGPEGVVTDLWAGKTCPPRPPVEGLAPGESMVGG
jgi:hypothetical protein